MDVQLTIRLPAIVSADDFNVAAERYDWPMLCDPSCAFRHPKHRELLSLWRNLAGQDGIPFRRQLTARVLKPYLTSVALYERVDEADGSRRYRLRLMGSDIVQNVGEFTGKFLDETVPEKFLPRWHALPDVTLESGGPVRLLIRYDTFNKAYMIAEYLSVPLRADDGTVKLVLYAGHYDGAHAWSEVDAEERARLGLEPMRIV